MIDIQPVSTDQEIQIVSDLARKIWTDHYVPIVGQAQIDFMLEEFQSPSAIRAQLDDEAFLYFILTLNGIGVGYLGGQPQESSLFLSKIYVDSSARGSGVGKVAINYAKDLCRERGYDHIWLTVNKNNTATIAFYQHMGFIITDSFVKDIGNGFVMDDYRMDCPV